MSYQPAPLILCCVAAMTVTAPALFQQRTALRISIAGNEPPPEVRPRLIVELQRGSVDQVVLQVTGAQGVAYASTVANGDAVAVDAVKLDGTVFSIFRGNVVSLESAVEEAQAVIVIRAQSVQSRIESEPRHSIKVTAGSEGDATLIAFVPRLSATTSVQEVLVTGIDSVTGSQITGRAVAPTIPLGAGSDDVFGRGVVINTDHRFVSVDDANTFARNTLSELFAARVSAELVTNGSPGIEIGTFVEIQGLDIEFDGAYYVAGVQHRLGPESYGGYSSVFRLRRADLGMFRIPSIDDEVLVDFDHGDINQPYRVGSWWDCDGRPTSDRSDDRDHCRLLRWPW